MSVDRQKLKRTSFEPATESSKRRLIVCVNALEGLGKTHFALTAPDPIAYLNLDIGTEGVVDKFINGEYGAKEIYMSTYRNFVVRNGKGEIDEVKTTDNAIKEWDRFDKDYDSALSMGVRTAIVDTGTEMWELRRLAAFGKLAQVQPHQYGPVNGSIRELVKKAYDNDVNLIFLHKMKKQYSGNSWNGKYEMQGFSDMPYLAQVVVQCGRRAFDKRGGGGEFFGKVTKCRQNAQLVGEEYEGDLWNFPMLACDVIQGSTLDEWE